MSIGFEWATKDPRHVPWEARYAELLRFVVSFQFKFTFSVLSVDIFTDNEETESEEFNEFLLLGPPR